MFVSTLVLPFLLAATPATANRDATRCPKPVAASDKGVFQRLGDLPPAEAFKAVWRSSDCAASVVQARDKMGRFPKPRR